jgi:hypothetical protein
MNVDTIRDRVAKGQALHPELAGRMERAAMLLVLRRVEKEDDGTWRVESEREPGHFYRVTPEGCECPDVQRAPRGYCKHRLAVALHIACRRHERWQRLVGDRTVRGYLAVFQ